MLSMRRIRMYATQKVKYWYELRDVLVPIFLAL